ncbi:MAG TPA: tRNA (adenosine(37)-N6)-threonylcarbamoyltransferase complex ATPase subunit type 1 TsaE [Capsulimonadaceae bacterium]|jgi:tRNA threonylcarbamoyladenosine biosynthesis protein TsaE
MAPTHPENNQPAVETSVDYSASSIDAVTAGPEQSREIGERLGRTAVPGNIICLIGDLGTGKTTLTQGIGRGLDIPESEVSSPTFMLISEHRSGRIPLYHFDVYRLSGPDDLHGLGFEDYVTRPDGLIVIEWADIVLDALPSDRLDVYLTASDTIEERLLRVTATGPESAHLLKAFL